MRNLSSSIHAQTRPFANRGAIDGRSTGYRLNVFQVPAHLYMSGNGGKTRTAETIYLNGVAYAKVNGSWRKSTVSPNDLMEAAHAAWCATKR